MCGIAGIVGKGADVEVLQRMLLAQKHRGPDNIGEFSAENIALGHNRLSIIDLSEEANQPFFDTKDRYTIIFNGEIYNYLELKNELNYDFKTNSDTEVLLASYIQWGKECLNRLNGMFSFAIWDQEEKKLFAARDRFGVKPFYYQKNDQGFYFSSEIKALFAAGINKEPDKQAWANYFVFGSYGMPNETFWQDIQQLSGGHYLEFNDDELKITKWYHFERAINLNIELSKDEIKRKYIELLEDSIKLRFRSDVPVGINLSGGIDSSTLLTFVNKGVSKERIEAFTFYTNNDYYDELPWVKSMVNHTKNWLNEILLTPESIQNLAGEISDFQDEPYGGIPTIAYSQIFKKAREKGTIVLLDGQGMDEQWAGYDYYAKSDNANIQGVNKSPFRKNVLSEDLLALAVKPEYSKPFDDHVLNLQYRDLFYTKIPRALRFNDRISMAYSTELREPFLDYRLVEFAFSLPLEYKIKENVHKYLLREIVSDILPNEVTYAPKRPLQTPQREWMANELREFSENTINFIKESDFSNWFQIDSLKEEWQKYLEGDQDSSFHLWQWYNFYLLMN
tara:strand:+ start:33316 stop:35007 length:1692 start_codon:yes stop_codon:yes gene_type:complete